MIPDRQIVFFSRIGLTLLFTLITALLYAQSLQPKVFSEKDLYSLVKQFHPTVKQAYLLPEYAQAQLTKAKGAFDPVFSLENGEKTFSDKTYGNYAGGELKLPLPAGQIKSALENNIGDLLNPETSRGQSSYLGVEIPLLQGLLTDKKRTALNQAKLFVQQSEQEKQLQVSVILRDAALAYWEWAGAFRIHQLFREYTRVSAERLRLIRISFQQGDRSAMDTTEAFVQWQSFLALETQAYGNRLKTGYELSQYLWNETDSNYVLPEHWVPEDISPVNHTEALIADTQSLRFTPQLRMYDFKLKQLRYEKKLTAQGFLPSLNFRAGVLNKNAFPLYKINPDFIAQNNKWGLQFSVPLFNRDTRGKYQQVKIKIRETELELARKTAELSVKLQSLQAEIRNLFEQIRTQETVKQRYQQLLRNEEFRLTQGESSLFLVNARETKMLEAAEKLVNLQVKWLQRDIQLKWISGGLNGDKP